jgi:hypothetical protein
MPARWNDTQLLQELRDEPAIAPSADHERELLAFLEGEIDADIGRAETHLDSPPV